MDAREEDFVEREEKSFRFLISYQVNPLFIHVSSAVTRSGEEKSGLSGLKDSGV